MLKRKVNKPKEGENSRLITYGMLEMGDVPRLALVMKLMPKELMNMPSKNNEYRLIVPIAVILHETSLSLMIFVMVMLSITFT